VSAVQQACWTSFPSVLGTIYVASTEAGVCKISIPDEPVEQFFRWLAAQIKGEVAQSSQLPHPEVVAELHDYLAGRRKEFTSPTHLIGTDFQKGIWEQLLRIPYGSTTTYGDIARRTGHPEAQQAVGRAVGANPLPIIVPCHRVLGAESKLHGYAAGIATKEFLLRLEGILLL
jgi:methylated-DNA-[protein]-cysteine S-methyltransferase